MTIDPKALETALAQSALVRERTAGDTKVPWLDVEADLEIIRLLARNKRRREGQQ